jgi:hypothetical protein
VFFFLFLKSKPSLSFSFKSISLQQLKHHAIDFTLHRIIMFLAHHAAFGQPVASVPTTNVRWVV